MIFSVGLLHGDMSQTERNEVINAFKKQEMPVLVATDVAGAIHWFSKRTLELLNIFDTSERVKTCAHLVHE